MDRGTGMYLIMEKRQIGGSGTASVLRGAGLLSLALILPSIAGGGCCLAREVPVSTTWQTNARPDGTSWRHSLAVPQVVQAYRKLCWAACLEMALNANDIEMNKVAIARHVYGDDFDQPIGTGRGLPLLERKLPQMLKTRAGEPVRTFYKIDYFWISWTRSRATFEKIVMTQLVRRNPVVLFQKKEDAEGHAVLAIGAVTNRKTPPTAQWADADKIHSLVVWDPLNCGELRDESVENLHSDTKEIIRVALFDGWWAASLGPLCWD